MSSQHDFITYSHTASGLKRSTRERRVTAGGPSDLHSVPQQPHISGEQLCKHSFYSQSEIPTALTSTDLHKHQTHVCASSVTCALIWLVTGAALHPKRATWLKVLIKSRLNIPRMLLRSLRPETYRTAAFICGWERRVCVQPEPKNNSGALLLSNLLTDWPIGHPGGSAGTASRVYKPGLDYEPCACGGVCSAVSH